MSAAPTPSSEGLITLAILAMGGEGGGVLADWLVDLAEHNGFLAQTTSVPGVAQRTGATIYYLEMMPADRDGQRPVMALSPFPGAVDIVVASELMEAGRALQRQLVNSDRTTLIASTHRVYSMTERTAVSDGRVDAQRLLEGARQAARVFVGANFAELAEANGSPIGAALYGALAGSGSLPFSRAQFEASIERGGVGVASSLKAFAAGWLAAQPSGSGGPPARDVDGPALGPRLIERGTRLRGLLPTAAQAPALHAIVRLSDYQDERYADLYLDRLAALVARAPASEAGARVVAEVARHLALWMTYEDTVRVADLKIRRSRFERVSQEVRRAAQQGLHIHEFLHPRIEEVADTLPAGLGRWLLRTGWARRLLGRFVSRGRVVRTSSLRGFMVLYGVACLRRWRPYSLRYQVEQQRIEAWLVELSALLPQQPDLALQVARAQSLVRGYGDTHARGWRHFEMIMAQLPVVGQQPDAAQRLQSLLAAALADDSGRALEQALRSA
ncbi:MAG: indolepyruvate oxidoreductase subunit beta family protein [Betaproteobacteria bacterium]